MTTSTRTRAIWFSTAVVAGVGGALGARTWELGPLRLVFVVGVSTVLGVLVALRWITLPPPAPPSPVPPVERQPAGAFQSGPGSVRQAVVEKQGWWEKDSLPAPVVQAAVRRPEFDARRARIAQCPHCGGFELDAHRVEQGYAFRCRNPRCGNQWEWAVGTEWPAVVVRRNLTGPPPG